MTDMPREIWAGIFRTDLGHGDYRDEHYWDTSKKLDEHKYTLTDPNTLVITREQLEGMRKTLRDTVCGDCDAEEADGRNNLIDELQEMIDGNDSK